MKENVFENSVIYFSRLEMSPSLNNVKSSKDRCKKKITELSLKHRGLLYTVINLLSIGFTDSSV